MAAPSTVVRVAVKALIDAEFAPEGWVAENDKFGRSMGMDTPLGQARIACYPEAERERPGRVIELVTNVAIQFHMGFIPEPDELIVVNPGTIEGYANRLRRRFKGAASTVGTADIWFMRLTEIVYPDDPTGNKSRFGARVESRGENPSSLPA